MRTDPQASPSTRGAHARAVLGSCAVVVTLVLSSSVASLAAGDAGPRAWETKLELWEADIVAGRAPAALCSARMVEGGSELSLFCRHELGAGGKVLLVRAGTAARPEPPFWSAPLTSPFAAAIVLADETRAVLLAGELVLRIESRATGAVVEGVLGTPIFESGFEVLSLCEWSNFPCPSDGNVCTDEACSPTGVCSHPPNVDPCSLPHATGGCFLGGCIITSCHSGYSHCDSSNANGCELNHNAGSGTCATPTWLGEHGADEYCDFGCGYVAPELFATRTGLTEAWLEARAVENSSCSADLSHSILLSVPEGIDWDLYVYRDCSLVGSSSTGTAGEDEQVQITEVDDAGPDDSFVYEIEVRYYSGHSCTPWSLDLVGTACD